MTTLLHPLSTAVSDDDQRDALSAPVRDPLWLLARQWQTGAFRAGDGGTPVRVALAHVAVPLEHDGRQVTGPIEPLVEAEGRPAPSALDTATRVRLAAELVRRIRDEGVPAARAAAIRSALAAAHPLAAAADSPVEPFAGRLPDAAALHDLLSPVLADDGSGGPLPPLAGVESQDAQRVEAAVRGWYAWMAAQPAAASGPAPATWDPRRLDHSFSAGAQLPDGELRLHATAYDGSGVDWYSFDRDPLPALGAAPQAEQQAVRPAPVAYPGMPRPRFCELEDGDLNLDGLRASGDPAQAVLATFAHQYANDWFLVPLPVAPGACLITALTVTDTFGTTIKIPSAAHLDDDVGPWRLWELTRTSPGPPDAATGVRVLPPPAPPALQGPVLEDVLVARDEMANLAWLIELTTTDMDGHPVDRHRRWLELRSAADPAFDPARPAAASYRLGTQLPDFWYPLVSSRDPDGTLLLALADVPPEAAGVADSGVRGTLIEHEPGTLLADEEASRAGTRVIRRARLAAGPNGTLCWRVRAKDPGQGKSASGLRFDVLA